MVSKQSRSEIRRKKSIIDYATALLVQQRDRV